MASTSTDSSKAVNVSKRSRLSFESSLIDSTLTDIDPTLSINRRVSMGDLIRCETKIDELELENELLKEKYDQLQSTSKHTVDKYLRQVTFVESEIIRLQKQLAEKNEQYYEEKKKWQSKIRSLEASIESKKNSFEASQMSSKPVTNGTKQSQSRDNGTDSQTVSKILFEEYRLKNTELNAKISSLETSLKDLQQECLKMRDLQCENSRLTQTCHELENVASESRLKLISVETDLRRAQDEKDSLSYQIKAAEAKVSLATHQSRLFEGEVKNLRSLLETYEAEFRIGKPDIVKMNKLREESLLKLRQEIDDVRKRANAIASEALSLRLESTTGSNPNQSEESQDLKSNITLLEKEIAFWKDRCGALEAHTRTDTVPGFNRVLHMAENPYSMAILAQRALSGSSNPEAVPSSVPYDELKRLRREVNLLRQDKHETDCVPTQKITEKGEEVKYTNQLNTTLAIGTTPLVDATKLNQRLKEMFKERITSFREAVYLLTGYKVDLYTSDPAPGQTKSDAEESKRLRLRSMYAESPEDSLLFQWRGDTLELLETPFASKLNPALFTYLHQRNSVPAFLSSLTMDLYENQTFLG